MHIVECLRRLRNSKDSFAMCKRVEIEVNAPAKLLIRELLIELRALWSVEFTYINTALISLSELEAHLSTLSIGSSKAFWISQGYAEGRESLPLGPKVRNVLASYEGSDAIVIERGGDSGPIRSDWLSIAIPPKITADVYRELRVWFGCLADRPVTPYEKCVLPLIEKSGWDSALLMAAYESCLGTGAKQFCTEWLPIVLVERPSLFAVTTAFFSRDRNSFYECWAQAKKWYPDEFWVVFWGDQLWQALCYCLAMQANKATDGIKGLPFSFMRRDWRRFSVAELTRLLRWPLYYDYHIRTGQTLVWELLFESVFV